MVVAGVMAETLVLAGVVLGLLVEQEGGMPVVATVATEVKEIQGALEEVNIFNHFWTNNRFVKIGFGFSNVETNYNKTNNQVKFNIFV